MGADDLFKKRKARSAKELQRQKQERAQNKRYLIVCEGEKTEPNYFRELLLDLKIKSQTVQIAKHDGKNTKGKPLVAITSTPCFEIWFLLHFSYWAKPFHQTARKSIGEQVIAELKKQHGFEKYGKGEKDIYSKLIARIQSALDNAKFLRKNRASTGSDNPSTDVDRLVLALQELSRGPQPT